MPWTKSLTWIDWIELALLAAVSVAFVGGIALPIAAWLFADDHGPFVLLEVVGAFWDL